MLRYYILFLILLFNSRHFFPQTKISIEFSSGLPYNIPLLLNIKQTGEKDLNLKADFSSKPLDIPIYWDWRIGYSKNGSAWELESIHHKIFLENNPPEIGAFSISHGLNFITINHSRENDLFIYRAGIGLILAHPESIIRNKVFQENGGLFNMGYYFTGPAVILGVSKKISLLSDIFANLELKFSAAYVNIPVKDGNAELYNVALHFIFGLGYDIKLE